jgi:hypothetical protein
MGQARPIPRVRSLRCLPRACVDDGKGAQIARRSSSRHTFALATMLRVRPLPELVLAQAKSRPGLRARVSGPASVGSSRCAKRATITSRSEMSATIARRPPQEHAKTSTKSTRRSSWVHSSLPQEGFPTLSLRSVSGRLCTAFSLSLPRSGDVPSVVETSARRPHLQTTAGCSSLVSR